ncbi:MAG: GNAT family protein [Candidatus Izemoplasma sp.]|nr:GNAT family protein [Candidatus Izemoplasma sp.]
MMAFRQPIITTKRLRLRPIKETDQRAVYDYAKRDDVGPNAGWAPHAHMKDSLAFIQYSIKKRDLGQPGVYAITFKENDTLIGTIEVHSVHNTRGEIGFVLHPDYWNQGIITEAAQAIIIYAFEVLKLKRLAYCHFHHNFASKRVCDKLGFVFEGVLRKKFQMYDGRLLDDVVYSLIDDDYENDNIPWLSKIKETVCIDCMS